MLVTVFIQLKTLIRVYRSKTSTPSMSALEKELMQQYIGAEEKDDKDFAVKNIDIRPLKLQNTYDPDRIIREVRVHGTSCIQI